MVALFDVILMFTAYYLMGLVGMGVYRDLETGIVATLDVPRWFDDFRMMGHALLLTLYLVQLLRTKVIEPNCSPTSCCGC